MLAQRPLLGTALGSITLPTPVPNAIDAIARGRGTEIAVILEITGFPKSASLSGGGAHPLLGNALLGGFGQPGESLLQSVTTKTLWLSDYSYRTKPNDLLRPNLWTEARMTRRADIEQTAPISQGAARRAQETTGDLEFADNDGFIRGETSAYSFEQRPAKIHLVQVGRPWSEATTVSQAIVESITRSNGSARVNLEDAASIIDTPLVTRIYGGTGLRDGTTELTGTSPPGAWGYIRQAKPLLEDPSLWIFRLADEPINAVYKVEERGLAFNFDTNVDSYNLLRLRASEMNEGDYATCLADGSIAIKFAGGEPFDLNAIRVDFEGSKSSGTYVEFMGDVMLSMLRHSMRIGDNNIDVASYQALPRQKIAYYFQGGSASPTGAEAFREIMESAFGTFGSVNDFRIGAKLFYPPSEQPASLNIVADEIFSVNEVRPPQYPIYTQSIGWGRNQNPLTRDELAIGSLSETEIEEKTRAFEGVYVDNNAAARASNLKATAGTLIESVFREQTAAEDAVRRLMRVWGVDTKAYEVECSFVAANVARGSVISVSHPDLDEKSGGKFIVYHKRLQLSKRSILLTMAG